MTSVAPINIAINAVECSNSNIGLTKAAIMSSAQARGYASKKALNKGSEIRLHFVTSQYMKAIQNHKRRNNSGVPMTQATPIKSNYVCREKCLQGEGILEKE